MRSSLFAATFLATLAFGAPALAEGTTDDWSGDYGKKAERRSDLVIGFSPGLALGSTSGYPNEIDKIDQPDWKASSGFAAGFGFEAWLGGALTDWFTFGVGGGYFSGNGPSGNYSGGAFLIRVETYPFYSYGGTLRDFALFGNVGAGSLTLKGDTDRGPTQPRGESGLASVGGAGIAYELLRAKHFAVAPTAEYILFASESLHAHQALIGARVVFYGGPG
ncbi:MAG TPA: hypothetical protein VNN72_14890 [Polyangiaceae bacterium]|nr:hypothetical protein [Polyangiaceae bacterium]